MCIPIEAITKTPCLFASWYEILNILHWKEHMYFPKQNSKKFKILTKFCKNNYLYVNWWIFYVSKSCVFCLVKNIFIQCIWRALDYEIIYETQGHETWNCQQKNHIASTKFQTQSCNGIQNLFGIFGSHIIVLVKKPTKKEVQKLLATSHQTWKNYATTSPCKQNEKDWEVATSPQAQRNSI